MKNSDIVLFAGCLPVILVSLPRYTVALSVLLSPDIRNNGHSVAKIWIISDGKPGHENQSKGLAHAIQHLLPDTEFSIVPSLPTLKLVQQLWHKPDHEDKPDLLIGAGHRTHKSLLAYKLKFKVPAIVLMKPSLPISWFDLCIAPTHDRLPPADNVLSSMGALNTMQPDTKKPLNMVLVGGPSKHYGWDSQAILNQIEQVTSQQGQWLLTTSRRTPDDFTALLKTADLDNTEIVPFEQTGPEWLPSHLPTAQKCWVSADSVSMVYEALTANCSVGLLEVPKLSDNRISKGVDQLISEGKVATFTDWQTQGTLPTLETPFNEAERCATEIINRFLV